MNGEKPLNLILVKLLKMPENSFLIQFFIPFLSDVFSALIVAILTFFITSHLNRQREWQSIRSEILDYHNELRNQIVRLADNPALHNNQHFIAFFSFELDNVRNLASMVKIKSKKKILKAVNDYIEKAYKEILLNDENEMVLNLKGNSEPAKYGAFIVQVDALLLNANKMLLTESLHPYSENRISL